MCFMCIILFTVTTALVNIISSALHLRKLKVQDCYISGEEKANLTENIQQGLEFLSISVAEECKDQLFNPVILQMKTRNSPMAQWLGLCAFTDENMSSIPGWETKILQPVQCYMYLYI